MPGNTRIARTAPGGRLAASSSADRDKAEQILFAWLAGRPSTTKRARLCDLKAFGLFAFGIEDPAEVAAQLFELGAQRAKVVAAAWDESSSTLAETTRSRRLTTLRALVAEAGEWGLSWSLRIRGPSWTAYGRATATGHDRVQSTIAELEATESWRDLGLLLLLYESGLRVTEAVTLLGEHVDCDDRNVTTRRKGVGMIRVPITKRCASVLARLPRTGPVFPSSSASGSRGRPSKRGHLSSNGARAIVGRLKLRHPHALRHAGAERADELTGGNIRSVQAWLGHKHVATTQVYLGRLTGVARSVVDLLGEEA